GDWAVVMRADQQEPEILDALKNSRAHLRVLTPGGELPPGLTGIISLLALDATEDPDRPGASTGALATLALVRSRPGSPLWTLTRGAETDPWQAQTWGLGRVAALEHPTAWGGLIDLARDFDPAALHTALTNAAGEDQIRVEGDQAYGRRLRPTTAAAGSRWWTRGATLITGGTGALGTHAARFLAREGAPHIVLVSRHGPEAPGAAGLRAELGDRVSILAGDVTDEAAIRRVIEQSPPITAVIHAAGATTERALADLGPDAFVSAKVVGAELLDRLLGDDLDAFIVYSSIASTWGSAYSGAYASANAHLDALVRRRRVRGAAGTALAWGPWSGGGLAGDGYLDELRRRGITALAPDQAGNALRYLDPAVTTVAAMDWERFAGAFTANRPSPLLNDLTTTTATPVAGPAEDNPFRLRWAALPAEDRQRMLVRTVCAEAAAELGDSSPGAVEADRPFRELGFDSLAAVGLRQRLDRVGGLKLPSTIVFDYPTPAALAEFIDATLAELSGGTSDADTALAELDRLDGLLADLRGAADSALRSRITLRLSTVLANWKNTAAPAAPKPVDKQLDDATDDQLFDLIKNEFGIS
ncbi:beta-ketoacyl reductase, partial [Paractinoplanes ferrugineus]